MLQKRIIGKTLFNTLKKRIGKVIMFHQFCAFIQRISCLIKVIPFGELVVDGKRLQSVFRNPEANIISDIVRRIKHGIQDIGILIIHDITHKKNSSIHTTVP